MVKIVLVLEHFDGDTSKLYGLVYEKLIPDHKNLIDKMINLLEISRKSITDNMINMEKNNAEYKNEDFTYALLYNPKGHFDIIANIEIFGNR